MKQHMQRLCALLATWALSAPVVLAANVQMQNAPTELTTPLFRAVSLLTGTPARLIVVLAVIGAGFYYFIQRGGEAGKKALAIFTGAVLILAAQALVSFFFGDLMTGQVTINVGGALLF